MTHQGTITIETDRLLLRKFTEKDTQAAFTNWMSDQHVTEYLRWSPHGTLQNTRYVIEDWLSQYQKPHFYQWAIVLKKIKEPIGSISAVSMNEETQMIHIGYCIGSKWWHQGYTSEALSAVIPFFFEKVRANRIESQHHPENQNSGKVMQKCGLRYEGTLRQADWCNKGICDACLYAMLASDHFKS